MDTPFVKGFLLGDGAVGKSCLFDILSIGVFPSEWEPSIFDNCTSTIEVDGKTIDFELFDHTGLEDYDRLRPLFYPQTDVFVVCYSISNPNSLEDVKEKWIPEAMHHCPGRPFILVGLKKDLRDDATTIDRLRERGLHIVTYKEGMAMAKETGAAYFLECSPYTGEGVRDVFQSAVRVASSAPMRAASSRTTFFKRFLRTEPKLKPLAFPADGTPSTSKKTKALMDDFLSKSDTPKTLTTFRLLIIGKTGCGKTTILSKLCGGNMVDAPNTTKGVHDIEKEIKFDRNHQIVAHDSEGFEAGQSDEVEVVRNFIERRSNVKDINDQLHLVWYCMEMNSRPIQHAEKEFFSAFSRVPVIALVTKFDIFVQDVMQKIEEEADEDMEELDDDKLERQASREAMKLFERYYFFWPAYV